MNMKRIRMNGKILAGLAALAIANVGAWFLRRHTGISEDNVDFLSGLLYGVAIATMLLGIIEGSRRA